MAKPSNSVFTLGRYDISMNPTVLKDLQHFVGKICTIFTIPFNRQFDERQSREHFVVRVVDINATGIWGQHPFNSTMSFFFLPHVVFIQEEVELDANNPEHAAMLKDFEQRTGQKAESDLKAPPTKKALPVLQEVPIEAPTDAEGDSVFVDVEMLSRLAADTKKNYETFKR